MEEKIKKDKYRKTIYACFTGYIVQAVINNFVPLLFLTFQSTYGIPLSRITMLVTINFGLQLLVDLASVSFVDRIGYRASMMIAHVLSGAGLLLLALLPEVLADPFVGILLAVMVYAVGGGLLEVLVSPVVEACPSDNKEKAMSLLHSFYCWGHVGVVLISTVFFRIFGIHHWRILACIWALIPLCNTVAFARVPIGTLMEEGDKGMSIRQLAGQKIFWVFMLMMLCAGASEQAVSQWASTFAEKGLGVSKAIGDLAGPMAFAVLMGASRAFYGKYGDKINLERFMAGSSLLCIAAYLCISLVQSPVIALAGCAVCGLSVGIMWPGTFSKAAAAVPRGGTALFALMALAGDLGCSGGPTLVGMVSSHFGDDLKKGVLAAVVFPLLLLAGIFFCSGKRINVKKIHMSVIFLAGFMLFCGGCGSSRGDNLKDCAGQLLIDPDLESDILYAKLSKAVVGGEYTDDFAEILRLIQDARSGSTWNKYWWSSEEYLLKSDEYPAESILERCDRYIPVLQEMIDRNVESYSFPFPMPLKEIFQLVLPHLEQIRSFARFRLDLQELEQDWQQAQMDRQAGQNPNGTLETLQDQLYNIAEPISDYNGVVGIWGQIEARAQREMVLDFCSRTGMQVPIYPVWDRQRKQYIYSQLVTDQKGKDTPVNVYTPYYQYGLAYKQETDRLVQELVEEGLFIRNEDGSVYLADWEKYRYHFD